MHFHNVICYTMHVHNYVKFDYNLFIVSISARNKRYMYITFTFFNNNDADLHHETVLSYLN